MYILSKKTPYCHRLKTYQFCAEKSLAKFSIFLRSKLEYITRKKIEIGKCEQCGFLVNVVNLQYYEFDHIDPTSKYSDISRIVTNTALKDSIDVLALELTKCRLLCAYCHRKHTTKQHIKTGELNRREKRLKYTKIK